MQARLTALLLTVLLCLTACRDRQKPFVVGVSQCSIDNWREKFNGELRTAALLNDSIEVLLESANDDDQQQISQINKFIDQGVDLLIVSPNQLRTISEAVDRAYDRGIPVILYDRKASSEKYTAFIGCDNHQIGYTMGTYIAQRLGGQGRVVEVRGLAGSSPALERHKGFTEALAAYPGITLVASEAGDWKTESGSKAMRKILATSHDFDYVFAHNDRMAEGARQEAERQGLKGRFRYTGVDALATDGGGLELVLDGTLDASYLYPTKGDEVLDLALRILKHEPYQRENFLQTSIVTRENAELSLMEAKDAEQQRHHLGELHQQVDSYVSQYRQQRVLLTGLVVILLLLIALVVVIYRNLVTKARLNHQLDESNEKLRQLNRQVIEQTHSRLVFFTNISHELRTPLTLIIDPVNQMLTDTSIRGRSRELLELIRRNAAALQQLVSTILDIRKIQNGKMALSPSRFDLAATLRQWVADFGPTAERKHITLSVDTSAFTALDATTDEEKLARIVFNLMSNALKYTPEGGSVVVALASTDTAGGFRLSVSDTGKGIAAEDCPHVFERFFQAEGAQAGTGVGLAVVKSYAELLGGTASVSSTPGKGTVFTVDIGPSPALPCREGEESADTPLQISSQENNTNSALSPRVREGEELSCTLLVIDDNDDIRQYIRTILSDRCLVLEAPDGERGLAIARSEVPDIILCDIMMPGIDGLEVCRRLKQSVATSHIPVVLLTAKALDEQRAEGYQCGADSYITKPFSSDVLVARIANLTAQRAQLARHYAAQQAPETPAPASQDPREQTFMQQLTAVIDAHLADSDFGVEEIGQEIGLSRVQLYRKVKALTGTSVVDLLRRQRLLRARHLLQTTHRTISEVAYDCGFSSPSYFSKCFKEEFGCKPGEVTG